MTNFIKNFLADEDGAVTVDWVVLTAGIVVLGLAIATQVGGRVTELTDQIETDMGEAVTTTEG